ncbi:hypothetical protein IAR55_002105 [Kwoniella newhampshirensis]|uniref:ER transporter 6TM N-terminal domain-containing protein n=1 Tax=Kwoniella newhampshirensis TaxID=1651941 RepID=A0AAW0YYL3_9TREE
MPFQTSPTVRIGPAINIITPPASPHPSQQSSAHPQELPSPVASSSSNVIGTGDSDETRAGSPKIDKQSKTRGKGNVKIDGNGGAGKRHKKTASFALTVEDKAQGEKDGRREGQGKSWMGRTVLLTRLRARRMVGHRWFSWIGPKLTYAGLRPVIRGYVASWFGLVLLMIVPVERAMGYAAFFVLVTGFMLPPVQPVVQTLEIYLNLFFFNGLAWAWVALGVFIAGRTRVPTDPARIAAAEAKYRYLEAMDPTTYRQRILYDGTYLQAKPAIVLAVFLAAGTGAALWWKLRTQPSPATFPLVLSCILIDIGLTTAAFYPYDFYTSGLLFFLPMSIQAGIGVLASLLIFPESVGHSFQSKFPGILSPLAAAMKSIELLFQEAEQSESQQEGDFLSTEPVESDIHTNKLNDWAERSKDIRRQLLVSLAGLPPLRAQQHYLSVDFSYSRLSGEDLRYLFDRLAIVQARSGGMAFFFDVIITNAKHSHLDSSAWSVRQIVESRPASRAASIRNEAMDDSRASMEDLHGNETPPHHHHELHDHHDPDDQYGHGDDDGTEGSSHDRSVYFGSKRLHFAGFRKRSGSPRGSPHGLLRDHRGSHLSLLDSLRKTQQPVGVYESTRYMDVERSFALDTEHVLAQLDILARGCLPVIRACEAALSAATGWILNVNSDRKLFSLHHKSKGTTPLTDGASTTEKNGAQRRKLEEVVGNLQSALDDFCIARLEIIKPYRHLFDPAHPADEEAHGKMHFRSLFQNFVAQYHLIEFTESLLKLLRLMEEFDRTRQKRRFWYPDFASMLLHVRQSHKDKHLTDGDDGHDNDAAFEINEEDNVLGEAKKRNPEYKPFDSPVLNLVSRLAKGLEIFSSRSFMYAIKAAILGALTSLPNFIASSASFYYFNRGIWCTIMAQLTLAVFSGDTTSAWLGRVVASFWGCLLGMVAWYIGCGSGQGNPYGLAAVCAVTFPMAIFFRVHFPGPVLTAVMTPVTFGLSYFNGSIGPLTYAQWGWDVAWRRFVCVMIGITAAWLFSYIPPVYSAKRAIRYSYAQTINSAGVILCAVLSRANDPHHHLKEDDSIRQQLITWRSKLNKLGARHANATYEYSLRGQWPEERYRALLDTLQDTLSLLSQLNHVVTQLDRPWRKALMDRTRLSDPMFLGDVLSVLSMCSTALRAGTALPQITPSPLVARFRMGKTKGLDLPHDPTDQHGELPSLVTVDVLESDNYMRYALGITTTFSLVARLDRIVVICKTLLGENFHISGLHLDQTRV